MRQLQSRQKKEKKRNRKREKKETRVTGAAHPECLGNKTHPKKKKRKKEKMTANKPPDDTAADMQTCRIAQLCVKTNEKKKGT